MSEQEIEVRHNPDEGRFEIEVEGQVAILEYNIAGKNIVFTHTEVPPPLEGRGYANRLSYVGLEYAKEQGYKVQPLCPIVKRYIDKHPEYQAISWGY